jgi:DNA helicase-2/ATP-dependent DNA helicase PcrA
VVFIVGCEENLFPHWKSLESPEGVQEERRLMYVAMTRAERFLYLTSAEYRRGQSNARSRFCEEVEDALG